MPRCSSIINEVLRQYLNKTVLVKLRNGIEIRGTLIGFDHHMNLLLADTEEIPPQQQGGMKSGLMLIRGDTILLVSPMP